MDHFRAGNSENEKDLANGGDTDGMVLLGSNNCWPHRLGLDQVKIHLAQAI